MEEKTRIEHSKINDIEKRITIDMIAGLNMQFTTFKKYIHKQCKENNISEEEAIQQLDEKLTRIAVPNKIVVNKGIARQTSAATNISDVYVHETIKKMQKDPNIFINTINTKREEIFSNQSPTFDLDFEQNYVRLVRKFIKENTLNVQEKVKNGTLTQKEQQDLAQFFKKTIISFDQKLIKVIDKDYTSMIYNIMNFFSDYGALETYTAQNNKRAEKLNMPFLKIQYARTKKGNKPKLEYAEDLRNYSLLDSLPMENRIALISFWVNRFEKEVLGIQKIIFITKRLNTSTKGFNGIKEFDKANSEKIRELLARFALLKNASGKNCKEIFDRMQLGQTSEDIREDMDYFLNISRILDVSIEEYEEHYKGASAEEDYILANQGALLDMVLYTTKDWAMESLIFLALEHPKSFNICNWGYMPEYKNTNKNSIQRKEKNILVGFDLPQFNMPIRLHMNLEELKKIIISITGKGEMPIYSGNDDMDISEDGKKKLITTSILIPISKENKKLLVEQYKKTDKTDPNYDFIAHLNWLQNPKAIPEKLKGNDEEKIAQVIDLNSGNIRTIKKELEQKSDDAR